MTLDGKLYRSVGTPLMNNKNSSLPHAFQPLNKQSSQYFMSKERAKMWRLGIFIFCVNSWLKRMILHFTATLQHFPCDDHSLFGIHVYFFFIFNFHNVFSKQVRLIHSEIDLGTHPPILSQWKSSAPTYYENMELSTGYQSWWEN